MSDTDKAPELSRPVDIARMHGREAQHAIEATAAECAALARRLDILAVHALSATFTVRELQPGKLYRVRGVVHGEVEQRCVVSLEPVTQSVDEQVETLYAADAGAGDGEELVFGAEEEDVEPLGDGTVDLGELAVQYLALGLDPFPHAPGVSIGDADKVERTGEAGPFAALAKLRRDGEKG